MRLPHGELQSTYDTIESKLNETRSYVGMWLRYQALWDLEPSAVFSRLGDDLMLWQQLLTEVKKSRAAVDTSDVCIQYSIVFVIA